MSYLFSKLRLGGLRARFGMPWALILEGLGSIFPRFSKTKAINIKNLPRKDIDHRFAGPPRMRGRVALCWILELVNGAWGLKDFGFDREGLGGSSFLFHVFVLSNAPATARETGMYGFLTVDC